MSLRVLLIKSGVNNYISNAGALTIATRHGHTLRGKAPGVAKTLEQRLNEEDADKPKLADRVNIGFPKLKLSRSEQLKQRLQHLKTRRNNPELEKLARSNNLLIDLDEAQKEYRETNGQYDLRLMADHYGIYKDLFGQAYFVPRVVLNILYPFAGESFSPVYCGNVIKPAEATQAPEVNFAGSTDPITGKPAAGESYWTLIATNPDGHFKQSNAEYLHWFVTNIPNGDVAKGDVIANYLQPFPQRGVGYQRFIFVLYKQNKKLDFSAYQTPKETPVDLEKRTFKTFDFYAKHQDDITPAGLAFYQTNWDETLTNFYHTTLNMKEPVYEYDYPAPYLSDQKFFPLKQPFNLYLDKHRDIKEVNKEYLERKLAKTHPFEGPEAPLRFPNAHPIKNQPSWLVTEIKKRRLGFGRINDY